MCTLHRQTIRMRENKTETALRSHNEAVGRFFYCLASGVLLFLSGLGKPFCGFCALFIRHDALGPVRILTEPEGIQRTLRRCTQLDLVGASAAAVNAKCADRFNGVFYLDLFIHINHSLFSSRRLKERNLWIVWDVFSRNRIIHSVTVSEYFIHCFCIEFFADLKAV